MTKFEKTVKAMFPNARIESHKQHLGKRYYLIRRGREHMYYAEGDTPTKAWRAAFDRLQRSLAPGQAKGDQ